MVLHDTLAPEFGKLVQLNSKIDQLFPVIFSNYF